MLNQAIKLPSDRIDDNPFQTRQAYGELEELATDIGRNGLLQPPVGRVVWESGKPAPAHDDIDILLAGGARVQLAFGHRRLRACRALGWVEMPITLKVLDDARMARMAWAENVERKDLTAIEEAQALRRMMEQFGWTQAEVGEEVGLSRPAVANKVRLLGLPEEAQGAIQDGLMTEKHGRALLRLAPAGEEAVLEAFNETMVEGSTTAELADDITRQIRGGVPLVTEPVELENLWGRVDRYEQDFPLDWTPEDVGDLTIIVGACEGCQFKVQFNGDPVARCIEEPNECYGRKRDTWLEIQEAYDLALIGDVVDIPFVDLADCSLFGSWSAPAEILDDECRQCPHFRVTWARHLRDDLIPVEADVAERVVYACHDDGWDCRVVKRAALAEQDEEQKAAELQAAADAGDATAVAKIEKEQARTEKLEALQAEDAKAKTLIDEWIGKRAPLAGLWELPGFRAVVAKALAYGVKASESEDEAAGKVLAYLLDQSCMEWVYGGGRLCVLKKTENLLKKLEA